MKRSVKSFYNKSLMTRGIEKVNQVLKRQKAKAEIEKALQKKAENKMGKEIHHIHLWFT